MEIKCVTNKFFEGELSVQYTGLGNDQEGGTVRKVVLAEQKDCPLLSRTYTACNSTVTNSSIDY